MSRSALRREAPASASPCAKALPGRAARAHAGHLIDKLAALYPPGDWALLREVRNTTGITDVLRYADAIAVHLYGPSWRLHGFEVKLTRSDFLAEIRDMEKSGPIKLFCGAWWLVVSCPWRKIVHDLDQELPDRWGLIEVGTGKPVIVVQAIERVAEEPTPGFSKALIRAALRQGQDREEGIDGGPLSPITRPGLSRSHVGLGCNHVASRPPGKERAWPRALPCESCKRGLPPDDAVVEAMIREATGERRQRFAALFGVDDTA